MAVTDLPPSTGTTGIEDDDDPSIVAAQPVGEQPVYLMPPTAYYDETHYLREQRELFGRTWNFVGHHSDLPEPGTFLTTVVAGEPVVVVRDADGSLQAYVNICRHRGMTILEGDDGSCTGTCGASLRCPYHGWEWDTGGTLVRVPQRRSQFSEIEADALGLYPLAVGEWAGFIFVHPDPSAAGTFDDWIGDYPAHCGDFPWYDLVEVHRVRTELACNWKFYVENHIDWLHLWYLHEESLGMYDHPKGEIHDLGMHWASMEIARPGREREQSDGLIAIPGMPDDEVMRLRANLIFPNVPFVTTSTQINTYQVIPTGPETSLLDLRVFAVAGGKMTDDALAMQMHILVGEDGKACERMQEAVRSPHFRVGPLATTYEAPITSFHRAVEQLMGPAGG